MKALPFRLKIALLSTAISGLVMAGFGTAAYFMIARQKAESLDTEIRSLGLRHRGWIANRQTPQRIDENFSFIAGEDNGEEAILLLADKSGSVIHVSPDWPESLDPQKLDTRLEDDHKASQETADDRSGGFRGGRGWGGPGRGMGPGGSQVSFTKLPRFFTTGVWRIGMMGTPDTTLVIGMNTRHANAELTQLRDGFLLALPLALALVGIGGWIVAGRALRPLRVIAETAEQVTARGLDQRIPSSDEDPEITRVILVLNRMIDRLESSFQQATRFSADASHELKTPLAIMQGELENALQEAPPDSKEQQVFGNLLEETQRLKTITRGLLLLALADSGQLKPSLEDVDFPAMLEGIIEDARALAEETHLSFEVELARDITVRADPTLLRTAVLNLFVNAVKYNEPGGRIRTSLESRDQHVVLTISNSGPGIPQPDQSRIFTRFHRVNSARDRKVDGVGLGLSLAREIVRAHGGELELRESRPGWTCFELRIPMHSLTVENGIEPYHALGMLSDRIR